MNSTRYTKKQAAKDKALREEYKHLTLPFSKLEFMARAPIGAIYLCNIYSDAEDLDAKWHPMLGGFQVTKGKERFASDSQEEALAHAQRAKAEYEQRLQAYYAECAQLDLVDRND